MFDIDEQLIDKLNQEFTDMLNNIQDEFAAHPTDTAYKIAILNELRDISEYDSFWTNITFTTKAKLLKTPNLLEWFYSYWIKSDDTYRPMLTNFMEDTINSHKLVED